jgi:hypothetical protein
MRKTDKVFITILLLVFIPIMAIVIWYGLGRYHLPSFEGKVVDADTKVPIEGAAVLVVYYKTIYTIAGSNDNPFDAQEAVTNAKGEFKIPEKSGWFGKIRGTALADVTIFKPGYGVFPNHRLSEAVGENKTWPPPRKYIVYELPRLKTKEERIKAVNDVSMKYELEYDKQRHFIEQLNREFKNLGMKDMYVEREGNPSRIIAREVK